MIDLSKYSIFPKVNVQTNIVHDKQEDYESVESFNKSMSEIRQEYSVKEKLSYESAINTVLTD